MLNNLQIGQIAYLTPHIPTFEHQFFQMPLYKFTYRPKIGQSTINLFLVALIRALRYFFLKNAILADKLLTFLTLKRLNYYILAD